MTAEKLVAGPLRGALAQVAHLAGAPEGALPSLWPDTRRERLDRIALIAREALASLPSSPPREYKHWLFCNGDRRVPAGEPGTICCCFNAKAEALAAASPVQGVQAAKGEDYPGQAYVHAHNRNIKRAEENAIAAGQRAEGAKATHLSAADLQPLKDACDRQWESETPLQIIAIAANAIHWRGVARKQEITDALMSNNQLEQLLFANWTGGTSPAHSINIKVLAEDIAKLLNALATPAAPPVAEKTELDQAGRGEEACGFVGNVDDAISAPNQDRLFGMARLRRPGEK